ncbi:hypothetical protein FNV43_RR12597 [Rhamnella rubrinervis]|uniref:SnoaL-like domain-containing protein n=1 Tax=Rhamnella rubrinervis TaxID=2594499 RepID=A0A8K0MIM8_9ROSA|nr:hypothetical protein FNV43_RR12597 [Rhamnella rubrinervis]
MMTMKDVNLTLSPPIPITFLSTLHNSNTWTARILLTRNSPTQSLRLCSSINRTAAVTSPAKEDDDGDEAMVDSAADVVRKFYGGINAHDLTSVEDLIADRCVYEDLVFPRPFVGRKDILQFFRTFTDSVGMDLQFVIDNLSTEDSSRVGVTWHLEWNGKPFPFSKGCSFYQLEVVNGKRQIIYGRDSVEPAIKPGETALVAIRGVAWLLRQFPQLADRL